MLFNEFGRMLIKEADLVQPLKVNAWLHLILRLVLPTEPPLALLAHIDSSALITNGVVTLRGNLVGLEVHLEELFSGRVLVH